MIAAILLTVRTAAVMTCFAAIGLTVTLGLAMSVPALFGYQSLTMLSGSMEPALDTGAVVIDETISPLEARPGDVLTFIDPGDPKRLLTHRLRSVEVRDQSAVMVTIGDANDASETWDVPLDGTIGRVMVHIPLVGYARAWVNQNSGRATVLTALALVGLWTLLDVWLPQPVSTILRRGPGRRRTARAAADSAAAGGAS